MYNLEELNCEEFINAHEIITASSSPKNFRISNNNLQALHILEVTQKIGESNLHACVVYSLLPRTDMDELQTSESSSVTDLKIRSVQNNILSYFNFKLITKQILQMLNNCIRRVYRCCYCFVF